MNVHEENTYFHEFTIGVNWKQHFCLFNIYNKTMILFYINVQFYVF